MIADGVPVFVGVFIERVVPNVAAVTWVAVKDGYECVGIGGLDGVPVGKHFVGVISAVGEEIAPVRGREIIRFVAKLPNRDRNVVAQGECGECTGGIGGVCETIEADDDSGAADILRHSEKICKLQTALAQRWQISR